MQTLKFDKHDMAHPRVVSTREASILTRRAKMSGRGITGPQAKSYKVIDKQKRTPLIPNGKLSVSPKKKKTVIRGTKALKKKAWKVYSEYIRRRDCKKYTEFMDWGRCYTCDKDYTFEELQAGHFIPQRHNNNLFDERGTHSQCVLCNIFLHGNGVEYTLRMLKDYGPEVVEELRTQNRQNHKFTPSELEEIIVKYQSKLKELEER